LGCQILVFFTRLLTGLRLGGLLDYMFDRTRPVWLRALSLFSYPIAHPAGLDGLDPGL